MSITAFLLNATTELQRWLGLASVLFLLHAGALIWTAGDNPAQRSRGWRQLVAVLAGLAVILFARTLVSLIYSWAGQSPPPT